MDGREVFRFAISIIPKVIKELLKKSGESIENIKYIIPHQANSRIIDDAAKKLNLNRDKFLINLEHYGNTSAASIAILLDEVRRERRFSPGSRLVLAGFGGGLTWGASYIEL